MMDMKKCIEGEKINMTQESIYESESGRFVGRRTIREYKDKAFGNYYVILEGRHFDCWFDEETNRFEV